MSKQTIARGTFCSPSSRCSSYTGSAARSSASNVDSFCSSSRCRAFWSASSISCRLGPRCGIQIAVRGSVSSISSRSATSNGISSSRACSAERDVRAREIRGEHRIVALVLDVLDELVLARQQLSRSNAQHRDHGILAIARVAEHVAIAALHLHHHRRLLELLQVQRAHRAARAARSKSMFCAASSMRWRTRRVTSAVRPSRYSTTSSIMLRYSTCDLQQDARRLAPADVVVETGALRHLLRHVVVARAHGEDPLDHVERAPHRADVGVRAEVAAAVVHQPPRDVHARERLVDRDLDVRIRLVVAQRDVEARPVLLDEIRLEHQRVRLGGKHDRLDVGDLPHEHARLRARERIRAEVAPHPRAQPLRLTHVQHLPRGVLEQVHAGRFREVRKLERDLLCELGGHGLNITDYSGCTFRSRVASQARERAHRAVRKHSRAPRGRRERPSPQNTPRRRERA